jgi:hypothetical protein
MTIKQILTALETAEKQFTKILDAADADLKLKEKMGGAYDPAFYGKKNAETARGRLAGVLKASELK